MKYYQIYIYWHKLACDQVTLSKLWDKYFYKRNIINYNYIQCMKLILAIFTFSLRIFIDVKFNFRFSVVFDENKYQGK